MNYEAERVQRVLETGGSLKMRLTAHDGTETPASTKWLNVSREQGEAIAAVFDSARTYTRDELLACLTGSGADAYEWLANLIGAEDEEIDAAREAVR